MKRVCVLLVSLCIAVFSVGDVFSMLEAANDPWEGKEDINHVEYKDGNTVLRTVTFEFTLKGEHKTVCSAVFGL